MYRDLCLKFQTRALGFLRYDCSPTLRTVYVLSMDDERPLLFDLRLTKNKKKEPSLGRSGRRSQLPGRFELQQLPTHTYTQSQKQKKRTKFPLRLNTEQAECDSCSLDVVPFPYPLVI